METVGGLRPNQESKPQVRQKKGRLTFQRPNQSVGLNPQASPVDTFVRVGAAPDVSSNLIRLSEALGSLTPALTRLHQTRQMVNAQEQEKLAKEQEQKLSFYEAKVREAKADGAINAAQVKEIVPELVEPIAYRIAQSIGESEGEAWVQDKIQAVLEDDDLRLNTAERKAYFDQVRSEAMEALGEEDEFYVSGFMRSIENQVGQHEVNWMRETAAYHEKVQGEAFTKQVESTLVSGGDLEALDRMWAESSSLSNLQRKELIASTVIQSAIANQDYTILERLPQRFQNAEIKEDITKAKQAIEGSMFASYTRARQLDEDARKESIASGKREILDRFLNGELVNAAEYSDPELNQFAVNVLSRPQINTAVSKRTMKAIESKLFKAGTTGDFSEAFSDDPYFSWTIDALNGEPTVEDLRDMVFQRDDLNSADKVALIDNLPNILEGVNFIRDPDIQTNFSDTVGSDVRVMAQSAQGSALQLKGYNLQSMVRSAYDERIRQEVMAYMEENGQPPRGYRKLEILDKATEVARKRLEEIQRNFSSLMAGVDTTGSSSTPNTGRGQMSRNNEPQQEEPADEGPVALWEELE